MQSYSIFYLSLRPLINIIDLLMRKILKFVKWLLIVLLFLLTVPALIFYIKNKIFLGGTDNGCVAYLSDHKKDLQEIINNKGEQQLFSNAFYENQVFMLGEVHGFRDVQNIDKFMLFHLNKKIGVRHYVAEMDSTRAGFLNNFLKKDKPDTILLKQFVNDLKKRIPQQASQELFHKWIDIYNYNRTLPDSLKIIVIGVDQDFNENESTPIGRDSIMIINFEKFITAHQLEHEKFYGYFGYSHVLQDGIGEKNLYPFAAKMKRSKLSLAKKIQSIVCLPVESEMYLPANDQYPSPPDERTTMFNVDGPFVLVKGINDLKKVTEEKSISLFSLNEPNSPFQNNQRLAGYKSTLFGENLLPNSAHQKTVDLFQYVIFIRGSGALTAFK
jgi:hypothetical protein